MPKGRLFVVATPIGNMGDLSSRASQVLADVDVVAAEDTRVARKLLSGAGITANRIVSYRDANEASAAARLLEELRSGRDVALVSDAGTPCVSDPGYRLVRAAAAAGIDVCPVPGASSVLALLSVSGLPTDRFAFEGFLPARGAARRNAVAGLTGAARTVVLFESPQRIVDLLGLLADMLGDPQVAVGRELTKKFEEVLRGHATDVAETLAERETGQGRRSARGEFTVAVRVEEHDDPSSDADVDSEVARLVDAGLSARDIATALKPRGVSRNRVYDIVRRLKGD